ncbi:MAG TPA: antibiotic biosynthesis monooxygenase family protein [Chloroflexota bacterium]|nr:antibiotic biosynthesis monooxygenase family protein [Chloroflexota bacterium]
MAFVLIRQIRPLPGREEEAIAWYKATEPYRRQAGQTAQTLLRSVVDPTEYQLIQRWSSQAAYERWRQSPERERLSAERARLMTAEPAKWYITI